MKLLITILLAGASLIFAQDPSPTNATQGSADQPKAKPLRVRFGPSYGTSAKTSLTHPQPVYPQEAKDKKIQGTVKLHIVIGTDGKVTEADAISGDPLLTQPAVDAVRQWTYRPTLVNGEPVEVDTQVVVIFELNGKKPRKEK